MASPPSPPAPGRRGVVAVIQRANRYLVIRRAAKVIAPGRLCFPGGGMEPGESEQQTLIREMEEELGVVAEPVEKIWESVTPWKVEIAWWSAKLAPAARLRPNPEEVAAVSWLAFEELQGREELLESNREFLAYLKSVERTQSEAR